MKRALLKTSPLVYGHITVPDYTPRYWFQHGNRVIFEPVPDSAYRMKLFIAAYPSAALIEEQDVPTEIPSEFRMCIVDFACYVLSLKLKRYAKAAEYYNKYINNLNMLRNEYIKRQAERKSIHEVPDSVNQGGRLWAH